jgi:predicted ester cyclase
MKILMPLILLASLSTIATSVSASEKPVPIRFAANVSQDEIQNNKTQVMQFYRVIFNERKFDKLSDFFAAKVIDHDPMSGDIVGIDNVKASLKAFVDGFPDLKVEVLRTAAEGDLVFVHLRLTGTNTAPLMGMAATGKKMDFTQVDIIRCTQGKFSEHWMEANFMTLMQQMGMGH